MFLRRHRQGIVRGFLAVLMAVAWADISWAQSPLPPNIASYIDSINTELDQTSDISRGLRTRADASIWLNVIAGVLGLIGGTLPNIRKQWTPIAAGVIGLLAGTTTIVNNNVYGVDSALLRDNADALDDEVLGMRSYLSWAVPLNPKNEDEWQKWKNDTQQKRARFEARRAELRRTSGQRGGANRSAASDSQPAPLATRGTAFVQDLFPTLHAQSAQQRLQTAQQRVMPPSWVSRVPRADDTYVYFVAAADGPDLSDAKDSSLQSANLQVAKYMADQAGTCPIGVFRQHAANATEVVDTYFAVRTAQGSNERVVRYSTMVKVNKALADRGYLESLTAGKVMSVQQGNVWTPGEFGGRIGVYVGTGPRTLPVVVFTIAAGDRRFVASPTSRRPPASTPYRDLKRKLTAKQILTDVQLTGCQETTFQVQGQPYELAMLDVGATTSRTPSARVALTSTARPSSLAK